MNTPSEPTSRPAGQYGWKRFVLPVAWMATIFFGSGNKAPSVPDMIPNFDKFVHVLLFGLLATLWAHALARPGRSWRTTALFAFLLASGYGATDEFHQSFNPDRSADVFDWVADTLGAALATALYCGWPAYRRLLDRRVARRARSTEIEGVGLAQKQEP